MKDLTPELRNCAWLEVKRVADLAGKFRGAKTVAEGTQTAFMEFYRQVGQNLTPWRASPPKYKKRGKSERLEMPDTAKVVEPSKTQSVG